MVSGASATALSSVSRPKASSPFDAPEEHLLGLLLVSDKVSRVRGSCSVVEAPDLVGRGRRHRGRRADAEDGHPVQQQPGERLAGRGSMPVRKIETSEPGLTKPATRAGSVRLTETAILPSGICSVDCTAAELPNLRR